MSQKRFNPWLKLIEAQKPLFLACEILNIDDLLSPTKITYSKQILLRKRRATHKQANNPKKTTANGYGDAIIQIKNFKIKTTPFYYCHKF